MSYGALYGRRRDVRIGVARLGTSCRDFELQCERLKCPLGVRSFNSPRHRAGCKNTTEGCSTEIGTASAIY